MCSRSLSGSPAAHGGGRLLQAALAHPLIHLSTRSGNGVRQAAAVLGWAEAPWIGRGNRDSWQNVAGSSREAQSRSGATCRPRIGPIKARDLGHSNYFLACTPKHKHGTHHTSLTFAVLQHPPCFAVRIPTRHPHTNQLSTAPCPYVLLSQTLFIPRLLPPHPPHR